MILGGVEESRLFKCEGCGTITTGHKMVNLAEQNAAGEV